MIRLLFAVGLYALCSTAFSQKKVMYFKDGTTLEFSKIVGHEAPDFLLIKTASGEKKLRKPELVRYFDPGPDEFTYIKPKINKKGTVVYMLTEQVLMGTVSVYRTTEEGQPMSIYGGGHASSADNLYHFGRGDTLQAFNLSVGNVLGGEIQRKQDSSAIREVRALLFDSPTHQASLDTIKRTVKRILEIVEDYNMSKFRKPTGKTLGMMLFFPDFKTEITNMSLSVNDSVSLPLSIGKVVVFKVPVNEPCKICFVSDLVTHCELMEVWTTSQTRNLKIDLQGRDEITFKQTSATRVQYYLQETKKKAELQKKNPVKK